MNEEKKIPKSFQLWFVLSLFLAVAMVLFLAIYTHFFNHYLQIASKDIIGFRNLNWYLLAWPIWSFIFIRIQEDKFDLIHFLGGLLKGFMLGLTFSIIVFILLTLTGANLKIFFLLMLISLTIFSIIFSRVDEYAQPFIYFFFIISNSIFSIGYIHNNFHYGTIWSFINLIILGVVIIVFGEIKIFLQKK